jgi:hypothetical protein
LYRYTVAAGAGAAAGVNARVNADVYAQMTPPAPPGNDDTRVRHDDPSAALERKRASLFTSCPAIRLLAVARGAGGGGGAGAGAGGGADAAGGPPLVQLSRGPAPPQLTDVSKMTHGGAAVRQLNAVQFETRRLVTRSLKGAW